MTEFIWPENFPANQEMLELLQKTAKASWKNDSYFTLDHIQKWLDNFQGEVFEKEIEQRLALWLLCNFTYYNDEEIKHLCYDVYKQLSHDLIKYYEINKDEQLIHLFDKVCFAAMGNASESGGFLLYYFRQESGLGINKFYYPTAFPKEEENIIVFVDDATLSGETAYSFFKNNLTAIKHRKAYYITLFASEEAIRRFQELDITIISSTILGKRERCFS